MQFIGHRDNKKNEQEKEKKAEGKVRTIGKIDILLSQRYSVYDGFLVK